MRHIGWALAAGIAASTVITPLRAEVREVVLGAQYGAVYLPAMAIESQALVEKHEISRSDYDARETEATAAAQAVEGDRAAIVSREQKIAEARSLVTQREAQIEGARIAPQHVQERTVRQHLGMREAAPLQPMDAVGTALAPLRDKP